MKRKNKEIFRSDVVGSMLRPKFLLDAQDQMKKGEISHAELTMA
jgi:methionine synthase II (cobalamin-independent)